MTDDNHDPYIEWIDMTYDPVTGLTTVTGASDPDALRAWQEVFHNHKVEIDSEYLNKDGTANLRKKIPKEWQEEWQ